VHSDADRGGAGSTAGGIKLIRIVIVVKVTEVIFEVASAQSNVGLSTGITNAGLSCIGKVMLILNMWIGRLEIIPVLMLFRAFVKGFEPI
jgi:trk system potassium uptake protein TrkH